MSNVLLFFIGIACLVLLSHSIPLDTDARIVNGMNTNTSVYPFIASFRVTYWGWYLYRFCGASLIGINPPIIMTAAHCVDWFSQADNGTIYENGTYAVTVHLDIGRTKAAEPMPNTPYQTLNLTDLDAQLFIHPQWDPYDLVHDIAILIFRNQTLRNDTKYANIPDQYDDDEECCTHNEDLFAIGWGANGSNSSTDPKRLQKTTLQFQKDQVCRTRYGVDRDSFDEYYSKLICAGGNNTDICYGDSGGPLFRYDDDDDFEVIGVTSFVIGGCNTNGKMPQVIASAFTGVGYYRNWIDKVINLIVYGITAQPSGQPTHVPTQTDSCSSVYNNYFHVFCSIIIICRIL